MATSATRINASFTTKLQNLRITRSEPAFPISFTTQKLKSPKQFRLNSTKPNTDHRLPSPVIFTSDHHQQDNLPEKKLSDRWMEIHGEDDWIGLLDPFDPTLRSELIRYGEMSQACYDAFDSDPHSIHCGSCKYLEHDFFAGLEMDTRIGYTVTRYLYATSSIVDLFPDFFNKSTFKPDGEDETPWNRHLSWIGYVAVSDDDTSARIGRRDIAVVWRGTVTRAEWIHDLLDILQPISSDKIPCRDPTVMVESGFEKLYTAKQSHCDHCHQSLNNLDMPSESPREQVLEEIERLVAEFGDNNKNDDLALSITITGHSLGSALAVLSAFDVAETGLHLTHQGREVPVSVFSFAGPRVGNRRFQERLEKLNVKVLRVYNVHDVVPTGPGFLVNEHWPRLLNFADGRFPWSYCHVGTELELDHDKSPVLKAGRLDKADAHNLELLLHLIDGYQGRGKHFELATPRDIALVNKDGDILHEKQRIPPFWRQDRNKGLVRDKYGQWKQPKRSVLTPKWPDNSAFYSSN